LFTSVEVLTQVPLHEVWPGAQPQAPLVHVWPAAQRTLQPPQLLGSLAVLVHAPLQTC
jgi:hypothetical protein